MNWTSALDIVLLLRLVAAHVLVDHIMGLDTRGRDSATGQARIRRAVVHGAVAALATYLLAARWTAWWLPVIVFAGHVVSDVTTARRPGRPAVDVLDQLGHILLLTVCWLLLSGTGLSTVVGGLSGLVYEPAVWALLLAYAAVIWPAGRLVGAFTARWKDRCSPEDERQDGLDYGGLWIGRLERILVVTFILLNHFEAIGFLVAAKSILRYGEISRGGSRREAEYVLIGTMMSFMIAIIAGVLAAWLMGTRP